MPKLEVYRNGKLLSTTIDESCFPDEKTIQNMKAAGCKVLLDGKVHKGNGPKKTTRKKAK